MATISRMKAKMMWPFFDMAAAVAAAVWLLEEESWIFFLTFHSSRILRNCTTRRFFSFQDNFFSPLDLNNLTHNKRLHLRSETKFGVM
jgi:hypothetical protein